MNYSDYETATKRMILMAYTNEFFNKLSPDEFVDTLNRIFKYKHKIIRNLALYVQAEDEKGHPADKVLKSLDFFAVILKDFSRKVLNQPFKK